MNTIKKLIFTALALALFAACAGAQTNAAPTSKKAKPAAVTSAEVQALKEAIASQQAALAAQQQQIQALRDELHQKDQVAQQAQTVATNAAAKADAAQAQATQQQQTVGELKSDVADLKTSTTNAALSLQETQKDVDAALHDPMSIHYKGITFTLGGFVAAEFARRSRSLGADVTTPFNSLTMPGASQSNLPEFFGSARQSRPTLFVQGRLKNVELSSYLSADFLSAGVTSSATQTNSYTLRLRQAWGQAKFDNGWSFLGGQMWSLLTEGKEGIAPSDDLGRVNDARPATIDSAYNVGFTFARQYGIRVTKNLIGKKVWFAVAMENAQGTLTTHGNGSNFLLGEAGASNNYNSTSNYTFNPSPDVIAKLAFDPGFGHYEVFGMFDRFQDRIFPCGAVSATKVCDGTKGPTALGAFNDSKNGGGVGANARWNFDNKHVVFGLHGFGGSGVGRYGAAQLSDLAINADGTVHLIKDLQGLATLEWHSKKLDIYTYTGAEYAARTWDLNSSGKPVGYGSPLFNNTGCYTEIPPAVGTGFTPGTLSNCTGDTRAIIEGTLGFWYRFYTGPKGSFRFGTQYSYVTRQTWSGLGASPEGLDGMVFTSFRYYLP
jgi:hypothetical protein